MAAACRPGSGSSSDDTVKGHSETDVAPTTPTTPQPAEKRQNTTVTTTTEPEHGLAPAPAAAPELEQEPHPDDPESAPPQQPQTATHINITPTGLHPVNTGPRPWKVILGCFCLTVPTYGLLSAIGLFQTYWHRTLLLGHSESDVAWIISVFSFLDCLFAGPAGVLFDRYAGSQTKSRWLLGVGSAVYAAAFVEMAWAGGYGALMGCVVVAGVAAATPTTIAFSVPTHWFTTKGGIAMGCVTLGAPLGGIFFSLVLQALFDRYTWRTAALILVGIMSGFLVLGNLLVETNVLPREQREQQPQQQSSGAATPQSESPGEGSGEESGSSGLTRGGEMVSMLRSPKFWLVSYALFAYELVLFIQWGSIPSYAVAVGLSDEQFYLMMSYNIGAAIGRAGPPWLSDRVLGPLNATLLMNILTLLVVLTIWLPLGGSSIPALFVVIVLMGIGTGSFVPLGVSCINALSTRETAGTWVGSAYSIASAATLIGNPVSAVILSRYQSHGLLAFLAAVLFSGMISAAVLRWLCKDRQWVLLQRV